MSRACYTTQGKKEKEKGTVKKKRPKTKGKEKEEDKRRSTRTVLIMGSHEETMEQRNEWSHLRKMYTYI